MVLIKSNFDVESRGYTTQEKINEIDEDNALRIISKHWLKAYKNLKIGNDEHNNRCLMVAQMIENEVLSLLSIRSQKIVRRQLDIVLKRAEDKVKADIKELDLNNRIRNKDETIDRLSESLANESNKSVENLDLQKIYKENQDKFNDWVRSFGWVRDTTTRHINRCSDIFIKNNIKSVRDYFIYSQKEKVTTIDNFRKFIEFCKIYGYITFDQSGTILYNINSKGKKQYDYDDYLPSFEEMKNSLNLIREVIKKPLIEERKRKTSEIDLLLYQLSIESGTRWKSIERDCFQNFDINKLQVFGNISVYEIKKAKKKTLDNKKGLFMFCRTKTIMRIIEIMNQDKEFFLKKILHNYKRTINDRTQNNIVNFKYHRNYGKSLMNEYEIEFNVSEYIQSRISGKIGWKHYSEKLNIAVKNYEKLLPHWEKLLD